MYLQHYAMEFVARVRSYYESYKMDKPTLLQNPSLIILSLELCLFMQYSYYSICNIPMHSCKQNLVLLSIVNSFQFYYSQVNPV